MKPTDNDDNNAASNLLRQKLDRIYKTDDTAPINTKGGASVHQQYKDKLLNSSMSTGDIQNAWHDYYQGLPDDQKKQVWDEFYEENPDEASPPNSSDKSLKKNKPQYSNKKNLLKSLLFGTSIGIVCIAIVMFGFFNQVVIAPFITPSRNLSVDSIIVSNGTVSVSPAPVVIIPKINAQIPVVYSVQSISEAAIETGLQDGVVHYPITAYPGQDGNGVIFGHSAGNIFNPGLYKYAFSLLHYLKDGDTFTINYKSKSYTYQVFNTEIVSPSDVSVIYPIAGHTATFTLITCNPPGLSTDRLVVQADQIYPDPTNNSPAPSQNVTNAPSSLPSQSPSLWSQLTSDL